jgi:hypothetical protein
LLPMDVAGRGGKPRAAGPGRGAADHHDPLSLIETSALRPPCGVRSYGVAGGAPRCRRGRPLHRSGAPEPARVRVTGGAEEVVTEVNGPALRDARCRLASLRNTDVRFRDRARAVACALDASALARDR